MGGFPVCQLNWRWDRLVVGTYQQRTNTTAGLAVLPIPHTRVAS